MSRRVAKRVAPHVVVPGDDEDFVGVGWPVARVRLEARPFIEAVRRAGDVNMLAVLAQAALQKRKRGRPAGGFADGKEFKRDRHIVFEIERLRRDGVNETDAIAHVADAFGLDESTVGKIRRKLRDDVRPCLDWYVALLVERGKIKAR